MLKDKLNERKVKDALKGFSKLGPRSSQNARLDALKQAYAKILEQIFKQALAFRELARKSLLWLVFSKRLLTTHELEHALAVKDGDSQLEETVIDDVYEITVACVGLVTVDESTNIISLVHYTTQQFFEADFAPLVAIGTQISAGSSKAVKSEFNRVLPNKAEYLPRLSSSPFFDYATNNWGHYVLQGSVEDQSVMKLRLTKIGSHVIFPLCVALRPLSDIF